MDFTQSCAVKGKRSRDQLLNDNNDNTNNSDNNDNNDNGHK